MSSFHVRAQPLLLNSLGFLEGTFTRMREEHQQLATGECARCRLEGRSIPHPCPPYRIAVAVLEIYAAMRDARAMNAAAVATS